MLPEKDPSRIDAIIQELQTCENLWKEASEQAKQSGAEVSQLGEEVNILLTTIEGKLLHKSALCCSLLFGSYPLVFSCL